MSAQHMPGPWMVRRDGSSTTFRALRFTKPGSAEYLRNAAGNIKHFRSEEAALAAIAKAPGSTS